MVDIISSKALKGTVGSQLEGIIYVGGASVKQTARGTNYIQGTALSKQGTYDFKIWDSDRVLGNESMVDKVYHISGKIDEYRGARALIITAVHSEVTGYSLEEFEATPYNADTLKSDFRSILGRSLTQEGTAIWKMLVGQHLEAFFTEYAARKEGKNHDNVKHGLLAHSLKVTQLLEFSWGLYNLESKGFDKDLLFIGTSLHDLGKVLEYSQGSMSATGRRVSHRSLATEILAQHKAEVVELKGEDWYYQLMSIFEQHHGEYEEKPRTFGAMVVHFIDMFESSMESLISAKVRHEDSGAEESLYYRGFFLS